MKYLNDIVIQKTFNKDVMNEIPLIKKVLKLNKEFIIKKLNEFKEKNPGLEFIVVGSSALTLLDELYTPINDVDIMLKDMSTEYNKVDKVDVVFWDDLDYTLDGWENRTINIEDFNILGFRDSLICTIINCHKINKMDKIYNLVFRTEETEKQFLEDLESFKIKINKASKVMRNYKRNRILENIDSVYSSVVTHKDKIIYKVERDIDEYLEKTDEEIPEWYLKY